jgi:hypothetical protein
MPSGFMTLDDKRLKIGAGGIKRRGVSGAPGPYDDDIASFAHDLFWCPLDCELPFSMHRYTGLVRAAAI